MTLESEIRLLEEELGRLRDDGIITPTTSISSGIEDFDKIIHTLKSNERLLKSKVRVPQIPGSSTCGPLSKTYLSLKRASFTGTSLLCVTLLQFSRALSLTSPSRSPFLSTSAPLSSHIFSSDLTPMFMFMSERHLLFFLLFSVLHFNSVIASGNHEPSISITCSVLRKIILVLLIWSS